MFPLISTWTINQGSEEKAVAALKDLAEQVREEETNTLVYLVHTPDMEQPSLPTPPSAQVVFFEVYKDKDACFAHINGPAFQGFLAKYGDLFLSTKVNCPGGGAVNNPYLTVEFLRREGGFIRPDALTD